MNEIIKLCLKVPKVVGFSFNFKGIDEITQDTNLLGILKLNVNFLP